MSADDDDDNDDARPTVGSTKRAREVINIDASSSDDDTIDLAPAAAVLTDYLTEMLDPAMLQQVVARINTPAGLLHLDLVARRMTAETAPHWSRVVRRMLRAVDYFDNPYWRWRDPNPDTPPMLSWLQALCEAYPEEVRDLNSGEELPNAREIVTDVVRDTAKRMSDALVDFVRAIPVARRNGVMSLALHDGARGPLLVTLRVNEDSATVRWVCPPTSPIRRRADLLAQVTAFNVGAASVSETGAFFYSLLMQWSPLVRLVAVYTTMHASQPGVYARVERRVGLAPDCDIVYMTSRTVLPVPDTSDSD